MRLAAISDMHGNAVALEAVAADLKKERPDAVVCLGDLVVRGPQPAECLAMVRELDPYVVVRGNADYMFTRFPPDGWQPKDRKAQVVLEAFEYDRKRLTDAEQHWLAHLPTSCSLTIEGTKIELFHASPWSHHHVTWPWAPSEDLWRLREDDQTQVVLFGHTHHPFVRQAGIPQRVEPPDRVIPLVVNSGSVGAPFDGDNRASYVILEIEKGAVTASLRRVPYDVDKAVQTAKAKRMPNAHIFEYAVRHADYYMNCPEG